MPDHAIVVPEVCVCYLLRDGDAGVEVLLGRKKTGLGLGRLVAPGGKLERGESAREAVVREVAEETGLQLDESAIESAGSLLYPFPFKSDWSQRSWVFLCRSFGGELRESAELAAEWMPVDSIPFDLMWDDAKYWLPSVLAGGSVASTFEFGEDLRTVSWSDHPAFADAAAAGSA